MTYTRYYNGLDMNVHISTLCIKLKINIVAQIINNALWALYGSPHIRRFIFRHATLISLTYL